MITFYAVDPGLAKVGGSGWAFFADGGLTACGVLRNLKQWVTMNQRIAGQRAMLDAIKARYGDGPVVSEWMCQIYKVPAQDLIDLQTLSGALGDLWVKPRDWKGNLPREVEASRSLSVLSPSERMTVDTACLSLPKSIHKEVMSAVGIGLSVAKRCHKKVGFPV